jgi:hypothetical protein
MAIRRKAKKDPVEVLKKEKERASLYRDEAAAGHLEEVEPRVTRSQKKEAGGKKVDPTGLSGTRGGKRRGA